MAIERCRVPVEAFADLSLSRLALRVLVALGRHLDDAGQCWASQTRLGDLCGGMTRQRAQKGLNELKEAGYLVVIGRKHRACLYQVLSASSATPGGCTTDAREGEAPNGHRLATPGGCKIMQPPGGAQTLREPEPPLTPPLTKEGNKRRPLRAPKRAQGARNAPPRDPPPDPLPRREGEAEAPLRGASSAMRRGANGHSLKTGPPVKKPPGRPRRTPFQFALAVLDEDGRKALTDLAMDQGEKAALSAFGFDANGRRT